MSPWEKVFADLLSPDTGAFLIIVKATRLWYNDRMKQSNEFAPGYGWRETLSGDVVVPDEAALAPLDIDQYEEYSAIGELTEPLSVQEVAAEATPGYHEVVPVAVNLKARAFAIESLMAYYNQRNKSIGASTTRELHVNPFDDRYGKEAPDVERNMHGKLDRVNFEANVDILNASSALRENGYPEDKLQANKAALKSDINREFGAGNAVAKKRYDTINKVRKTAGMKRLLGRAKPHRPFDEAA